jgi:hypothetical protein
MHGAPQLEVKRACGVWGSGAPRKWAQIMNDNDYSVGYRGPPKHTQFKKGRSGNPSGRRKAPPTFEQIASRLLSKKIPITLGKQKGRMVTVAEAIFSQLCRQALSGDVRATKEVFGVIKQLGLLSQPELEIRKIRMAFPEEDEARLRLERGD